MVGGSRLRKSPTIASSACSRAAYRIRLASSTTPMRSPVRVLVRRRLAAMNAVPARASTLSSTFALSSRAHGRRASHALTWESVMNTPFSHEREPDERVIRSLSARSGVPLVQVRTLFRDELRRLGMGAKVGSYLTVLTASNVRGMLRRKALLADSAQRVQACNAAPPPHKQRQLQRWEDDGGKVRRAP